MQTPEQLAGAVAALVIHGERALPCTPTEIWAAEQRLGIDFPSDVRAFYRCTNGTADMTDVEHGLVSLWPLEKWRRVRDEAPTYSSALLADALVFADHSYWCWAYAGVLSHEDPDRMVIYTVGVGAPAVIAETFTDFIVMILSGDGGLHGRAG
jgi:hypothetical protein